MVMRVEIHKQRRNRLQVTVRLRFSSGMLAVTPEARSRSRFTRAKLAEGVASLVQGGGRRVSVIQAQWRRKNAARPDITLYWTTRGADGYFRGWGDVRRRR